MIKCLSKSLELLDKKHIGLERAHLIIIKNTQLAQVAVNFTLDMYNNFNLLQIVGNNLIFNHCESHPLHPCKYLSRKAITPQFRKTAAMKSVHRGMCFVLFVRRVPVYRCRCSVEGSSASAELRPERSSAKLWRHFRRSSLEAECRRSAAL